MSDEAELKRFVAQNLPDLIWWVAPVVLDQSSSELKPTWGLWTWRSTALPVSDSAWDYLVRLVELKLTEKQAQDYVDALTKVVMKDPVIAQKFYDWKQKYEYSLIVATWEQRVQALKTIQ